MFVWRNKASAPVYASYPASMQAKNELMALFLNKFFYRHDGMDAGGRAMHGAIAEAGAQNCWTGRGVFTPQVKSGF